jgi:predicted nucleotidyltransferase
MGKYQKATSSTYTGLGDTLFSKTQQGVMTYLFGDPGRSYYASELIKLIGAGSGAVQRELKRLTECGLVLIHRIGNQTHYRANQESPVFNELVQIVHKSFGISKPIRDALIPFKNIEAAFIYGSIAKKEDSVKSDIDLMVISNTVTHGDLIAALFKTESQLQRSINITIYRKKEILQQLKEGNAFISRVLEQPKIWVVGSEENLITRKSVRSQ